MVNAEAMAEGTQANDCGVTVTLLHFYATAIQYMERLYKWARTYLPEGTGTPRWRCWTEEAASRTEFAAPGSLDSGPTLTNKQILFKIKNNTI